MSAGNGREESTKVMEGLTSVMMGNAWHHMSASTSYIRARNWRRVRLLGIAVTILSVVILFIYL